ncbi:MAG: response regulator transcription factor [Phycisphaerae bacterium]
MAKIVVVDDDPDIVDAVKMFLEQAGHDVATATNRDDGMALLKGETPDLAILDCMMEQPDDGIVMARQLRGDGFDAPIIMLSNIDAVTGQDYGQDEEINPVDLFQTKPVEPKKLLEEVNSLLNGKE